MLAEIARAMDPVHPPDSLRELWALFRWLDPGAEPSLATLEGRHFHPAGRTVPLIDQNTWLMELRVAGEPIGAATKPAAPERARELGAFLGSNPGLVGLALLQEVWEPEQREALLDAWGEPPPRAVATGTTGGGVDASFVETVLLGPFSVFSGGADRVLGDGLMIVSRDFELERVGVHPFETEGALVGEPTSIEDLLEGVVSIVTLINDDVLAEKGVLRATVNIPSPGRSPMPLELFTTHLFAPGGGEGDRVRRAQVDELVTFIGEDPTPGALRIVAGDFNIASGSSVFEHLVGRMGELGLEEVLGGAWRDDRRETLPFHSSDADRFTYPPQAGEPLFADDAVEVSRAKRIDYCFIERPRPSASSDPRARTHSFDLDFARPRRLRLERPAGAAELADAPLMSDHLGISLRLRLTPR